MADTTPRFAFEITEDLRKRVDIYIGTYGLKKAVFNIILDDFLNLVEKHGEVVIGVILSGAAKPSQVIPIMAKAEKVGGKIDD